MGHIKSLEVFESSASGFNVESFLDNIMQHVNGSRDEVSKYIDVDEAAEIVYVKIPLDALKKSFDSAEAIVKLTKTIKRTLFDKLSREMLTIGFDNK